jgi:hypothetical protein
MVASTILNQPIPITPMAPIPKRGAQMKLTSTTSKRAFGHRVNAWLDEPHGETFKHGKWRFGFPALVGFSILNALLTAVVFGSGGNLQTYLGAVILSVGALLAWLGIGALHYSDSHDRQLARGVSALDSVTLIFVIAHFCFLLWVYGHVSTLKSAEAEYKESAEKYNAKVEQAIAANMEIAKSAPSQIHNNISILYGMREEDRRWRNERGLCRHAGLLPRREIGRDSKTRLCSDAGAIRWRGRRRR